MGECLDYQCCEVPDWPGSRPWYLLESTRGAAWETVRAGPGGRREGLSGVTRPWGSGPGAIPASQGVSAGPARVRRGSAGVG